MRERERERERERDLHSRIGRKMHSPQEQLSSYPLHNAKVQTPINIELASHILYVTTFKHI
jgi:hypothetical protein